MKQGVSTFLLAGLVVLILLALHELPTIWIGEYELRHVNILSDLFPEEQAKSSDSLKVKLPEVPQPKAVASSDSIIAKDTVPPVKVKIPEGVTMIVDYGQDEAGGMSHFYQQLSHIEELGRPVRIAYFGDSFVEGDILSCDLREQLQTRFGGQGVGWVDCASQVHNFRQTVRHTFSGMKEYEVVKKPFKTQVQSLAQRYFMAEYGKATMHYEGVKARKHLKSWQQASFFFRSDEMFSLTTVINNDTTFCDSIEGNGQLQVITHTLPSIHNITYTVEGAGSDTYLYGTALESRQGIIVDNFSMRGSSGVTIGSIPASVLHEFARHRAYDLIILHFGLNVASDKSLDGNYKAYTRQMGQAIQHLRGAYPSASVLIVSMPDRDQRTDMGIHTMMGVESLVAYQQLMASDQQVAFFNLFEAMGGHESMKGLVDDGLANKDYTHLTFGGGRRLAKKLVESIEAGFDIYKQQHP